LVCLFRGHVRQYCAEQYWRKSNDGGDMKDMAAVRSCHLSVPFDGALLTDIAL
jgi:hypothetical protein